ncbi:MAG TPA: hypothetical protein VMU95_27255 [Trebonia sp.]|nr:hypothetical protein [Trebonia sp.]
MSRSVFRGAVSRGVLRGTALGGALVTAAALVAVGLGGTAQATMATSAVSAVAAPAAPAVACQPGLNKYDRTRFCFRVGMMVSVLRGRATVGTVTFDLTHSIQLSTRSRDFTERITISDVRVTGSGKGVRLGLAVSCASPCTAEDRFPQGRVISSGTSGVIDYRDGVLAGQVSAATSRYALSFTRPGDKPGGYSYQAPIGYRCDDQLPGLPAGCVFPAYVPYFMAMKGLAGATGNIKAAEYGPAHEGRPGSGHPLHRIASPAAQVANYAAVCSPSVVGPPPKPGLACDEYPFRSTREGGTAMTKKNRHVAWVPASVEAAKNKALVAFYTANRVLAGDPFWVVP